MKFETDCECRACEGTGLYVGMAEQVAAAGHSMVRAAEEMKHVAFSMDDALFRHRQFMDDWLARFEAVLGRLSRKFPIALESPASLAWVVPGAKCEIRPSDLEDAWVPGTVTERPFFQICAWIVTGEREDGRKFTLPISFVRQPIT